VNGSTPGLVYFLIFSTQLLLCFPMSNNFRSLSSVQTAGTSGPSTGAATAPLHLVLRSRCFTLRVARTNNTLLRFADKSFEPVTQAGLFSGLLFVPLHSSPCSCCLCMQMRAPAPRFSHRCRCR
jgi:hypothetical protein